MLNTDDYSFINSSAHEAYGEIHEKIDLVSCILVADEGDLTDVERFLRSVDPTKLNLQDDEEGIIVRGESGCSKGVKQRKF